MIATTRGALLRGSATDALGDETDDNAIVVDGLAWIEARRNLAPNPTAANNLADWNSTGYTMTREVGGVGDFATCVQGIQTTLAAGAIRAILRTAMPGEGKRISLRAMIYASAPIVNFQILARPDANNNFSQTVLGYRNLPAGETLIELSDVLTFSAAPSTASGVVFLSPLGSGAIGDVLKITGLDIEVAPSIPDYLDGNGGNSDVERRRWLGAPNASSSVLEVASLTRAFDDFPVSIIEKSRREFDEASNAWRSVRYFAGRVPSNIPVQAGDRIRDNSSGAIYAVGEVERMARGLSGRSSVTLTMKRTSP